MSVNLGGDKRDELHADAVEEERKQVDREVEAVAATHFFVAIVCTIRFLACGIIILTCVHPRPTIGQSIG